jgi:hypothetical protein
VTVTTTATPPKQHWWDRNALLRLLFRPAIWKDIVRGVIVGAVLMVALTVGLSIAAIIQTSATGGGWSSPTQCGVARGLAIEAGCAIAYPAINSPDQARYWKATLDGTRRNLDGTKTYDIHFAADDLPPAKAFWSITTGDATTQLMVANPEHRYSVSSHSGLAKNADGSLDVYLGPTLPANVPGSNWLPTPRGAFMLWLRIYRPTSQTYTPPPIQEVRK